MWLVVTKVRSESFGLVTERRHDMRLLCAVSHMFAYWTFPVSVYLIFSSVVSRAFSALCVRYARVPRSGIILTPRLPLWGFCAKFRFCRPIRWWASPLIKIAYSITQITHSITRLIWFPGNRSFRFGIIYFSRENLLLYCSALLKSLYVILLSYF